MMKGVNVWQIQSQLLCAIQYGDIERLEVLLNNGADCDQIFHINSQQQPAICLGVARGVIQLVELLIKSGSAINRRDSKGRSSLHVACEMGFLSISELLVQNRADVNAVDNVGVSPIHVASKRGPIGLVQCLLSHGADVNRKDHCGKTPLMYACAGPSINFEIVRTLLANGANPDDTDDMGLTPLLYVLLSPKYTYDLVNLLVSFDIRLDVFTPDEKAPIHLIVQSDNADKWSCLKLLLQKGCNRNLPNQKRQTPVHLACLKGDVESLRILLSVGANPSTSDRLGSTPLSCAASHGCKTLVHLLVDGGLKINSEILKNLDLTWLEPSMTEPASLMAISRLTLLKYLQVWKYLEKNQDEIPATLIPYLRFEK